MGGDIQREVYLDVYFIINFAIDCISLYICGIALKRRSTILKLSVSSSIGAIWAVFELFIDIGEVYDFYRNHRRCWCREV